MYRRMLDKDAMPTAEEMASFCGGASELFRELNGWLSGNLNTEQRIVFPYGNNYGWGMEHRKKSKLICNVFPEEGAFTVMIRLTNAQFDTLYPAAREYMRGYIDNKYPCGSGGWIHYRVTCEEDMADIRAALALRCA